MNIKCNANEHPRPRYDTPELIADNFAAWRNAMELSHAMLMAGLQKQIGPDGHLKQAWRKWNAGKCTMMNWLTNAGVNAVNSKLTNRRKRISHVTD